MGLVIGYATLCVLRKGVYVVFLALLELCYVDQEGLKLMLILLPQPSKCLE